MSARMCPVCGTTFGSETAFCPADGARVLDATEAERMLKDKDPLVRTLIGGRYRIIRRIGEGGMGIVYLAEHEAIEKRVAVKVLKEQYAQREDVVRRFQQEAKSASRVKHEGVLDVIDFGRTEDGRFFLAMELLEGTDLAELLEREHSIEPVRATRIAIKIARALAAAHAKGVIHRDMKPENVFVRVGDDGREHIKIVDFGIAQLRADGESDTNPDAKLESRRKLTKTGMIFGTPEYMSPEQASGKPIDVRIDVYALGIILFEMLTGRTPFPGDTFMAILSGHLMLPVPTLTDVAKPGFHCSSDLEAVVRRALAKDPAQRFTSMGDMVEALSLTPEGLLDEPPRTTAVPPQRSSQFPSGHQGAPANISETELRLRTPLPVSAMSPIQARSAQAPTLPAIEPSQLPHTTIEATSASAPPRKSGGALVIGVVAVLAVVGVGGWFALRYLGSTSGAGAGGGTTTTTRGEDTVASANGASGSHSTASTPTGAPSTSAAAASVKLHVESTPSGAIVEREVGKDWVQVCDTTPCDVPVDLGATVHLKVTKGGLTADKKLLADHDQRAAFTLNGGAPVVSPPGPVDAGKGPAAGDLCEVVLDEGIKVWRPCKK